MAGTANPISDDAIDAIRPDLEAFASLWSALRTNYQGTNITKTVARLLHMYQPEDGVLAYERLLRTLYVLLEDFDGDGLRLLVSMVPPPKGVPNETIKEVFHTATGFVRLNAPIFHRNNATNVDTETNPSSSVKNGGESSNLRTLIANPGTPRFENFRNGGRNSADASTILRAVVKSDAAQKCNNKSPKIRSRESEVFRGFPSNEITTTQSHVRNMTHYYGPSMNYGGYSASQRYVDYRRVPGQNESSNASRGNDAASVSSAYALKWFEAPMLVRKNNYEGGPAYPDLLLKTADNKYIRLPITKINGPSIGNYASSNNPALLQPAYQTYYPTPNQIAMENNAIHPTSRIRDFSTNLSTTNHAYATKAFEDCETLNNESTVRRVENSRTILMDHDYELTKIDENFQNKENFLNGNVELPTDATIEKFRDAVKSRQRAIQEDIYQMDVVQSDEEIVDVSRHEPKTLDVKSLTVTDELKKGIENFLKRAKEGKSIEPPLFPQTKELNNPLNSGSCLYKSSPRIWKLERLAEYPESWKQSPDSVKTLSEELPSSLQSEKRISSLKGKTPIAAKPERTSRKVANSSRISSYKNSSFTGIEENNVGRIPYQEASTIAKIESPMFDAYHQANSISEFVNYRKQYYDALISIQRAKVAVANSLAISTSRNSNNCDPRVFQYLQQQHHLLHQQQQQLLMGGSQHPATRPTILQPGYSNVRNTAGLWIRPSDWKYPPCGRYAFPRQTHSTSSPSSCSSQAQSNVPKESPIAEDLSSSLHNLHRVSQRPPVKRRKLEDIVGKLKKSDN